MKYFLTNAVEKHFKLISLQLGNSVENRATFNVYIVDKRGFFTVEITMCCLVFDALLPIKFTESSCAFRDLTVDIYLYSDAQLFCKHLVTTNLVVLPFELIRLGYPVYMKVNATCILIST